MQRVKRGESPEVSVCVCVSVRRGRMRPGQPADLFHMFCGERERELPTHNTSLHLKRQNSREANHPQHYVVLCRSPASFSVDFRYQFQVKMHLTKAGFLGGCRELAVV